MWHLTIQCGEQGFVCWSVGRHWVGRSVWRDTDCTLHTETFPLSVWWQLLSETWSVKTYWKTACSKIVIWSIQGFWDVTCWHSSTSQLPNRCESSLQQDCSFLSYRWFEVVHFIYVIYFICFQYECALQKYSFFQNWCAAIVFRSNVQYN